MTNYQKNKEWFDEHELGFRFCRRSFAVNKETQKPADCKSICCSDCEFSFKCSYDQKEKWLKAEAKEDKVDWPSVQKDTLIEVNFYDEWVRRYFAYYSPDEHTVHFYVDGTTSKTSKYKTGSIDETSVRLCIDN